MKAFFLLFVAMCLTAFGLGVYGIFLNNDPFGIFLAAGGVGGLVWLSFLRGVRIPKDGLFGNDLNTNARENRIFRAGASVGILLAALVPWLTVRVIFAAIALFVLWVTTNAQALWPDKESADA